MKRPLNYKFLFFGTLAALGIPLCVFSCFLYQEFEGSRARLIHEIEYEAASTCARASQLSAKFQKKYPGKLDDSNLAQKRAWEESGSYSQACDENQAELLNALMTKYGFESD